MTKEKMDCYAMVANRKDAGPDWECQAPAKYYAKSSLFRSGWVPVCGVHVRPYKKSGVEIKEI